MKLCAAALVLVLQLPLAASAATQVPEQTITPIPSATEQRVEPVTGPDEQRVEVIDPNNLQHVSEPPGPAGPVKHVLAQTGKVAFGVLAAGVSIGAMIVPLFFF